MSAASQEVLILTQRTLWGHSHCTSCICGGVCRQTCITLLNTCSNPSGKAGALSILNSLECLLFVTTGWAGTCAFTSTNFVIKRNIFVNIVCNNTIRAISLWMEKAISLQPSVICRGSRSCWGNRFPARRSYNLCAKRRTSVEHCYLPTLQVGHWLHDLPEQLLFYSLDRIFPLTDVKPQSTLHQFSSINTLSSKSWASPWVYWIR